jgi:uncharacterized protein YecT (DUF1311 family)
MLIAILLMGAAPQTQADMNQRASNDFARADVAMNEQYRVTMALMKRMDGPQPRVPVRRTGPSHANALLQAQRAWLGYRDAQCAAQGSRYDGGTMQGMVVSDCKAKLTRARTAELKAMTVEGG